MRNPFVAAALLALAVTAVAGPASATCMISCKAALIGFNCQPATEIDAGKPLNFEISCETCCSPPGGPVNCSASELDAKEFSLADASGKVVEGAFGPSPMSCKKTLLFAPAGGGELAPGSYELRHTNMILLTFVVKGAGGCASDADCPACAVCVQGACKGLGLVACKTDADCAPSEACVVDPTTPCKNQCVAGSGEDAGGSDAGGEDAGGGDAGGGDVGGEDALSGDAGSADVSVDAGSGDVATVDAGDAGSADIPGPDASLGDSADGSTGLDGGQAGSDALASDGATGGKPAATSGGSGGGCSAGGAGRADAAGALALAALAGLLALRRRRRVGAAVPIGRM